MPYDYDLFVIGGGSGGVRCARIAAGHGAKVAIAESTYWGGTCVNVGCVPKKLMVMAADYGMAVADSHGFGWDTTRGTHDWARFIARKDAEIARLNSVYGRLLGGAGVEMMEARATFIDPHTLDVGGRRVTAERIVIAVGGRPVHPHGIPGGELGIVSDQAFHLPALPERVVLVGGGYIAVEFAGIMAGLGAEVDLVYRQRLPLRGFDEDMREALADALRHQGVRLHGGCSPRSVERAGEAFRVQLDGTTIETDLVFWAIGRHPNTEALGLDAAGVQMRESGAVIVDMLQQTSQPHIFAIGDVCDRLNLTPVAIAEGHILADRLYGPTRREWNFDAVPTAVFSHPPMATVGLTEAQAAERYPADIYLSRFKPIRHTLSGRQAQTVMKLVVEQSTQRVVGAHMLGDDAPEMMQGIAIAITAGATKQDFDRTVGIHPTGAEEWVTLRTRTRVAGLAKAAE